MKERSALLYFINSMGYDTDHKQWYKAGMSLTFMILIIGQFTPNARAKGSRLA